LECSPLGEPYENSLSFPAFGRDPMNRRFQVKLKLDTPVSLLRVELLERETSLATPESLAC
jgi:hypothetical protein